MQWKVEFTSSVHNCCPPLSPHSPHRFVYPMDRYALTHKRQAHKYKDKHKPSVLSLLDLVQFTHVCVPCNLVGENKHKGTWDVNLDLLSGLNT